MRDEGRRVGFIYLLYFVSAILAEGLIGSGHSIVGKAIEIISYLWYGVLTFVLCRLFLSVSVGLVNTAIAFSLIGCVLGILQVMHVPLVRIDPLVFFAIFCLLLGYLIYRSDLLPKVLGVLLALAGLGWLVFSLTHPLAIAMYIQGFGIIAEFALMLWLLIFGLRRPAVT
jgi:hypothetical protein